MTLGSDNAADDVAAGLFDDAAEVFNNAAADAGKRYGCGVAGVSLL